MVWSLPVLHRYALHSSSSFITAIALTLQFLFQGICDGAGAVILASEEAVKAEGLKPLARLVGYSVVGVEPSIMGIGPAPAIKNLLKLTNKKLDDMDLIEVRDLHFNL